MTWYEKYAKKVGVEVGDPDMVKIVLEGLEHNKNTHGFQYCPCELVRSKDNVCPCANMRNNKICRCGLFKTP